MLIETLRSTYRADSDWNKMPKMIERSGNAPAHNGNENDNRIGTATITLKWQTEIRGCLNCRVILATVHEIADNIAAHHALPADHLIRQRVSATLAVMHRNMEIGRLKKRDEKVFFYGHRRYFEDDLKTPKQEYQDLLSV